MERHPGIHEMAARGSRSYADLREKLKATEAERDLLASTLEATRQENEMLREAIATRQMCQCPVGDGRAEHFPNCPVAIALKIRALRLAVPESPQAPPEEAARELP